jgi:hypothetical protein
VRQVAPVTSIAPQNFPDHVPGRPAWQRLGPQRVEALRHLRHYRRVLFRLPVRYRIEEHDTGQIGQVRDGEPALQADVRACAIRDHLEGDVGLLAEFCQRSQLCGHYLGRADRPVQDASIQQHLQQRRIGAGQQSLPGQPRGHQLLDLIGTGVRAGGQDRPRVVCGLQQTGDQDVLEQPQRPRPGLLRAERPERGRVGQVSQAGLQPGERLPSPWPSSPTR